MEFGARTVGGDGGIHRSSRPCCHDYGDSSETVSFCLGCTRIHAAPIGRGTMERSSEIENLAFAGLSFVTAVLSVGIHELTGTWPSEFGHLGGVLFALIGVTIVVAFVRGRVAVTTETDRT